MKVTRLLIALGLVALTAPAHAVFIGNSQGGTDFPARFRSRTPSTAISSVAAV